MPNQTGGTDLLALALRRAHAETVSMPDAAGAVDDGADVPVELDHSINESAAQESHVERPR